MDELIHHCLRELSFDGDLGSNVSRLRDFVGEFYAQSSTLHPQTLDDAFYAFVWSLVVQQPTVRVGTIPAGLTSEVYIAPQTSAKRKAEAKGEVHVETAPPELEIVADAKTRSLDDLKGEYGDNLRIAVDPEAIYAAISGSHIRIAKLSPMVYSALQIITRGRDQGLTVVELGQKSKYDQKTCFYLVKQLIELDLVVKVRRGGVGTHFCIHKYFFDRNPSWKEIRDEETQAEDSLKMAQTQPSELPEETGGTQDIHSLGFQPIDARHLSSLPLVRARVVKLLKASRNHMHASNNLLLTIGFSNPTKTDRRFFQSRIRELIQQGIIEKVVVPSNRKKAANATVKCFRLVTPDKVQVTDDEGEIVHADDDERDDVSESPLDEQSGIKMNITIHKQITDLLEESGTVGMTLNELATNLCQFDKRTIELLLTRAEKYPPPSHLSDLGIAGLMETSGRERRHRYYTVSAYRSLVAKENLDKSTAGYADVDFADVGGFASVGPELFYDDEATLYMFQDVFKDNETAKAGGKKRKYPLKNPILPDGSVKQGRPRKNPDADGETKPRRSAKKRNRDEFEGEVGGDANSEPSEGKKRRAPKKLRVNPAEAIENGASLPDDGVNDDVQGAEDNGPMFEEAGDNGISVLEKYGRPPEKSTEPINGEPKEPLAPKKQSRLPKRKPAAKESEQLAPKKRGRPPKEKLLIPQGEEPAVSKKRRQSNQSQEPTGTEGDVPPISIKRGRLSKQKPRYTEGGAEGTSDEIAVLKVNIADIPAVEVGPPTKRARTEFSSPLTPLDEDGPMSPPTLFLENQCTHGAVASESSLLPASVLQPSADGAYESSRGVHGHHSPEALAQDSMCAQSPVEVNSGSNGRSTATSGDRDKLATSLSVRPITPASVTSESIQILPETLERSSPDYCANQQIPIDPVLLMEGDAIPPDFHILTSSKIPQGVHGSHPVPRSLTGPNDPMSGENIPDTSMINNDPMTAIKNLQSTVAPRTKVNVSHLRRENELYRVIEMFDGIANIHTKEFFEAHLTLIESLAQAGEPTSAPVGTRVDKRTANATFSGMESRGRIKILKTSITTHTGVSRPACIVYLPGIEQEKLNTFLADLGRSVPPSQPVPIKKIDKRMEYGADPAPAPRGALPLQLLQMEQPGDDRKERWSKNLARANQLFSYDDATIREVLLTERTTLGQLYGFIVGKALRARELHLSTLTTFERGSSSSQIVSHGHRIVHLSYFCHDLPLSTYCSVISSLSHDDELTHLLTTKEGRQTLVRDLPPNLHSTLQIGRSRARSRFLDTLETLRSLKLVTPLLPSDSDTPWITCAANGDHPTAYDVAPLDGWTVSTPMSAPLYWHFNVIAPLYLWVVSESSPPFWKDVPVTSYADSVAYWRLLQDACTTRQADDITPSPSASTTGPPNASVSVARSLRRAVSWNDYYVLTWHQEQYLKRFVDVSTATTPLQNEVDGEAQMQKICWVVSAPEEVVRRSFISTREKLLRGLEKSRSKTKRQSAGVKAQKASEAKALLARKAAEARTQREKDWDDMVHQVHPSPLKGSAAIRVRRVRARFLQSTGKDLQKWESEIADAVQEATLAATKVLNPTKRRSIVTRPTPIPVPLAPPPVASNPPEKSIEALIAQQGPPLASREAANIKPKHKRKKRNTSEEMADSPGSKPKAPLRRHRFQWNRDYEELARDASVIIRARCRNLPRLDWGAFEQLFPSVPRNTVRQRLAHVRESPGNEAYLNRLEDRWYELWVQHRGTTLLPDEDPQSPTNFDLIKHVEFLRNHIDKNALRVGFMQPQEKAGTIIPATLDQLFEEWDVAETPPTAPNWDFMWNATVEEGREKRLLGQAFTTRAEEMTFATETQSDLIFLAESALKMALGTPHESYDAESASRLLRSVGEQPVSVATKNLVSRGILSKLVRDPTKQKPGRQLKISEVNQNAIGGSIPHDTFQDAVALSEDISAQQVATWREWPLLASDGDVAALIQFASDNKVDFRIDTSQPQAARPALDWNSKKADDDQIETAIHVRFRDISIHQPPSNGTSPTPATMDLGNDAAPEHGATVDGDPACCRRMCDSLVDCLACLDQEFSAFTATLTREEAELALLILTIVRQAGEKGITKYHLMARMDITSRSKVFLLIRQMTDLLVPPLFWTGYSSLVLVSSGYLKSWSVLISESPRARIFPRRWFEIMGTKINNVWDAALRAVIGVILFRPGISQAELRWRMRSVYDRQEVSDILRYLQEEGFVKIRCDPRALTLERDEGGIMTALDDSEEKIAYCFFGESRHWYLV